MRRYNPKEIEPKWQKVWSDSGIYKSDISQAKNKHYIIPMWPYPSGDLHIGHWYNFAPTDTVARYRRMQGKNVLTTNGFDAFGLPAENAAIKRGIQPAKWTRSNITTMTKQIEQIGASYDWGRSVTTSDPEYYRWNQWLFLKLYEKGAAYRAKAVVNWCPKDKTVLANEQVIGENNICERCSTPVIQKEMESWYFRITDYTDQLLKGLETVDWPRKVKTMQENWIGKSDGMLFTAPVKDTDLQIQTFSAHFEAFRADTFVVIAPEHPLLHELVKGTSEERKVLDFAKRLISKRNQSHIAEEESEGIFTGRYIIDPVGNGELPIWVASYALAHYGTGIVKCSAHDERDFQFAKKYGIKLKPVLFPADKIAAAKVESLDICYTDMKNGVLREPDEFKDRVAGKVRHEIAEYLADNMLAKPKTIYRLRDWLISRQRYWGTPIPIIYCNDCGAKPVSEQDLPVKLPEDVEFELTGRSPLLEREDFVNTKCPNCGKDAKRETDTMDTFVDSSWYFLRYPDNKNYSAAFDPKVINQWLPVDHYIGGIEHAILHLLYARFIIKFLRDHHSLQFDEPFKKLTNQGIILGPDGHKMSKSRGNVVNPDEQVSSYGADSLRLYLMFMGPYDQGGPYNMTGIAGTRRFIDRFWVVVEEFLASESSPNHKDLEITAATHKTIKKVSQDIESLSFNTAISGMMELVNVLYKVKAEVAVSQSNGWRFAIETLAQLLAPFAPHITEEIWLNLGHSNSIHVSSWPKWDEMLIKEDMVKLAVQINGKVRSEIIVVATIHEEEAIRAAKTDDKIKQQLAGKAVKKAIYVPGRLVSLVV